MSGSNIVPFGRYKGQPVADMLADAEYMAWVEAQPWFRARYMHLLSQRDIEAANRTPVHNRLQTLFLDQNYQHAFALLVSAEYRKILSDVEVAKGDASRRAERRISEFNVEIAKHQNELADRGIDTNVMAEYVSNSLKQSIGDCQEQIEEIKRCLATYLASDLKVEHEFNVRFESDGADVYILWSGSYPHLTLKSGGYYAQKTSIVTSGKQDRLPIEIKPTVGDEYPAVLRQMKRNESSFLYIGEYQGEGATERQFVEIFAASRKAVIFKRDVDRVVAERLLTQLDAAGIGLTLKPDGKVTIAAGASPSPDLLASARVHREAIIALLQGRAAGAKPIIPVHQDDVL